MACQHFNLGMSTLFYLRANLAIINGPETVEAKSLLVA
jgi:hypothetical protein